MSLTVPDLGIPGVAKRPSLSQSDKNDEVSLTVNGAIYRGWTGVSVKQGIRSISGGFDLSVTDDWTKTNAPWPIAPGDECVVKIGNDPIIDGYVDDVEVTYDRDQHTIRVSGRDKAADLVDCSAPSGQTKKCTLLSLAKKLCAPFGINVVDNLNDPTLIQVAAGNIGESVFETLEKAARQRGALLYSDGIGNLVIGKTGTTRLKTALIEGQNIAKATSRFSAKERFSDYRVCSQFGGWQNGLDVNTAVGVVAKAKDTGVKRYRPLDITAELSTDPSGAQKRANWEAVTRRGKSQPITIMVEGHRGIDGQLWLPNNLVQVKAPWLSLFTPIDLLIVEADFVQNNEEGTVTTLELMPADALQVLKAVPNATDLWKNYGKQ